MRGRKPRINTTLPVRTSKSASIAEATSQASEADRAQTPDSGTTIAIQESPPEKSAISTRNALLPVAGGLVALALAGWGEAMVESGDTGVLSLLLYLAAIGIFAWSATLLPKAPGDLPSEDTPPDRPIKGDHATWVILGAGMGLAVLLDVATFFMLRADLKSELGKWLWLFSLAVTMTTGIALHKRHTWPAHWAGNGWPRFLSGRTLVIVAIVVIGFAAIATRFLALDTIPLGINADEGDRAATSIQILRQTNTESVFGNGWYQISMMYFTLLAGLLKLIGIGYVQARVFGVIASLIACGMLVWIGARHFNWRVGLMAGGIFATLGIALQFARETSESGPTAALWAISMAFFFEAARSGRMWAWAGAGLAGGFSIYFYPTGRLWAALAAIVCVYLFVHGLNKRRVAIARGIIVAAIAGIIVITPFAVNILRDPNTFTIRAQETSIFAPENPTRLSYYKPEWSLPQLLIEQTIRGVG
ncbi:MAG: glycosyltransferase family 39 protein, partial [Chloroflexia bacterium]